jgi:guanylate kinase
MTRGDLFVISAPSGAGKSTLCRMLLERMEGVAFSVSHTTRPPRPGEVDGRDYHFVSQEEFEAMVSAGEFLEWARVHENLYGTSRKAVMEMLSSGLDVILDIDVQGAAQVRERFPAAITIFILPPSWQVLEERLEKRGSEDRERLKVRLRNALAEMEAAHSYQYVVVNDELEVAYAELSSIVSATRCRSARVLADMDMAALRPSADAWFLDQG